VVRAPPAVAAAVPLPASSPAIADQDTHAGSRPAGYVTAIGNKPDNLKLISGIGKQNERRLNELGIWHFAQIAAWSKDNIDWIGSFLAFPGRIEREHWVEQAKKLAAGETTDFARRAARGEVPTSSST
jgi:predicted flap endonuclease-1-like 5' DNA nuclease